MCRETSPCFFESLYPTLSALQQNYGRQHSGSSPKSEMRSRQRNLDFKPISTFEANQSRPHSAIHFGNVLSKCHFRTTCLNRRDISRIASQSVQSKPVSGEQSPRPITLSFIY